MLKIALSLITLVIFIQIIEELLAMTDDLIYREMGRDGGSAAIPSHLSSRRIPPVIARSLA